MRVLVVEDDWLSRQLIREILLAEGHETVEARSAEEAFEMLRTRGADLVLMDIGLPGMSGIEALRRMKADPRTGIIPIVMLTAYAMEKERKEAEEAGCDGYITKPFRYDELVETLKRFEVKR